MIVGLLLMKLYYNMAEDKQTDRQSELMCSKNTVVSRLHTGS